MIKCSEIYSYLNILYLASPASIPFICSFDEYIDVSTNACGGLSYVASNLATLAGLEIDFLPGTTQYITDYTSIGKNNLNDFSVKLYQFFR